MPTHFFGNPGVYTRSATDPRNILTTLDSASWLPSSLILSGTASRDTGSTPVDLLRAGLLVGKITATGKYANSIIGLTQADAASGATSLTVTAAAAAEIVRRIGATGTFKLVGPPTAGGTVASQTVTYSAVNTTTGVITCTATSAAYVTGSLVMPLDGSETVRTVLAEEYGLCVVDTSGNNVDQPLPRFLRGGDLIAANVVNLTEGDAAVQSWLKTQLKAVGLFTFDNDR